MILILRNNLYTSISYFILFQEISWRLSWFHSMFLPFFDKYYKSVSRINSAVMSIGIAGIPMHLFPGIFWNGKNIAVDDKKI